MERGREASDISQHCVLLCAAVRKPLTDAFARDSFGLDAGQARPRVTYRATFSFGQQRREQCDWQATRFPHFPTHGRGRKHGSVFQHNPR